MQTWQATLFYRADLTLGEGPHWHPDWQQLLYVDIEGMVVGCIDPVTMENTVCRVNKRVGTVVPVAGSDQLVVGLQGSIEQLDLQTGQRKLLTKLETMRPDNRCNDGKCDAAGRLWIGTMDVSAKRGRGALYVYDSALWRKLDKRHVSNGLCWSADNRTMYYIDSFDHCIRAFDFDLATGGISRERVVVRTKAPDEMPDGMCIDTEGRLWVAIWGAGAVHCYDPSTGSLLGRVLVDAPHVSACAFGGADGRRLFITTAKAGLGVRKLAAYPLSGSIFSVDVGAVGAPMHPFSLSNFLNS